MNRRDRKILWWVAGIILSLFVLDCLGLPVVQPFFQTVGFLAFGWIGFLWRVLPQVHVRWELVISSVVCAVALVFGSHLFLRWLYREMTGGSATRDAQRWHWRWTLSDAGLVFLMFSAGIGAVGVVHQTAWIATSPLPLLHDRYQREAPNRIRCLSNLRQIGNAIRDYADANGGHYPDDWQSLFLHTDLGAGVFVCPSANDEVAGGATTREIADNLRRPNHCSYIYYGKGLSTPVAPECVIAAESLENHSGDGMNILFGDGHVLWCNKDQAVKLLATTRPSQ